jgi:outer membrane biogenesis lipoprotein LolB
MKKELILTVTLLVLTGCAGYTTKQEDTSYEKGQPTRKITTVVKTHTFWAAKSELAKSAVTQTDKSQSSKVGSVNETVTNNVLRDLTELAKALKP